VSRRVSVVPANSKKFEIVIDRRSGSEWFADFGKIN
jgi:hypothetical protein